MAKKTDPFEKFREVTLSSSSLSNAISAKKENVELEKESGAPAIQVSEPVTPQAAVASPEPQVSPAQEKVSKNATRELVSFHIDKSTKKKLGLLKYETDRSFGDLYCEAIDDLLKKYGK